MLKQLKKKIWAVQILVGLKAVFILVSQNIQIQRMVPLRVLNDEHSSHPNSGFDFHPHSNMEIISYIVNGEITHEDRVW